MFRLNLSTFSSKPFGDSEATISMRCAIDQVFTQYPFFGSRQIMAYLRREDKSIVVGRNRVRRLMDQMGLETVYKRPKTSKAHPENRVYPYLLRKAVIESPQQVWCADITYIPSNGGTFHLGAIMDWATRKVLSCRLSNTLDEGFCVEALKEVI